VRETWGHPELRDPERWRPLAEAIAARMKPDQARFFRLGCGLADGAQAELLRALNRWGHQELVDPRPHLSGLRCPVYLFHSRQDDVIPCMESAKLLAAMPAHVRAHRYVTGLYEHTRRPPLIDLLRRLPGMGAEALTMLRMLRALVRAGTSQ
jgi:pimeloyl-ACP methyl ester carboxylesterase